MKKPFVTKEQLEDIVKQYPTPFHLYDEKGMRENARRANAAFSWNPGFKEYFAVKATPTPALLKILRQEGCGADCTSLTELMMAEKCGFQPEGLARRYLCTNGVWEDHLHMVRHNAAME